ncbi:MAG: lysine--tRNA ligase [Candidatus Moranbacteria bacterium]|nr:lysine--tRNA ligase [Candidatus Moranbacteria bacterium]
MREDIRKIKLEKMENLKNAGMEVYPEKCERSFENAEALEKFDEIKKEIFLVGRITSMRPMGGSAFCHIEDGSGKIQLFFNKKNMDQDKFKLFVKSIELGDFVQVKGELFLTKTEEKSLKVVDWKVLSKSLAPFPTEHFGFKNEEEKFRKRYLDLFFNKDEREMFVRRAAFWRAMRNFMIEKDFMEVETPYIETTTGGAEARPFKTHHNDFDMDVFMRISIGELWQKRLMAAGFEKTFEIGRAFRNEGTSPNHLQEFTNMEFYWAYANYDDGMELTKEMYRHIAKEVYGKTKFETRGHTFDFADDWKKIDYVEEIKKQTGVDVVSASEDEMKKKLKELGVKYEGDNKERLTDSLWKYCRKNIGGPAFLINHPLFVSPLAKEKVESPGQVSRFQVIIGGAEVGNGYSELNDPLDQRERFEEQQKLLDKGDEEAMMPDWEFVEMLEHGMPPTCGFGVGERLFAFLEDKTLREVTLFPLVKPKVEVFARRIEDDGSCMSYFEAEAEAKNDLGVTLKQAQSLIKKHIKDPVTKLHSLESEAIMRGLAKHFGEDEEKWGIIGLLHDIDWDATKEDSKEHCIKAAEILKKAGASDFLIETIQSHNYGYEPCEFLKDKNRETRLQHSLAAAETLTGLIMASVMIRPDKKIDGLELKSLKKKFKNKKFAEKCNRDIICECEKIGLSLDEFLEIGLNSLKEISDELGV